MRPFARSFDLIQAEYGWTDGQVLDLTLGRLRQIRDVIATRRGERRDEWLRVEEAKLAHICGAVHGAAGNKRGANQAQKIRLRPKKTELPSTDRMTAMFGEEPDGG